MLTHSTARSIIRHLRKHYNACAVAAAQNELLCVLRYNCEAAYAAQHPRLGTIQAIYAVCVERANLWN